MKKREGFTIVELMIVIIIIAILVTISIMTAVSVQKQSRDSSRAASTSVIADALEKYYEQNGEYPGCEAVTSPSADVMGIKRAVLKAPQATSGVVNSIVCQDIETNPSNEDVFAFVGDGSTDCQTGSSCSSWELKYLSESNNDFVVIKSRRSSKIAAGDTEAPEEAIAAPTGLTITASMSGSNAQATAGGGSCEAGTTITRQMRYAENSTSGTGTWSSYTSGNTLSQPANQGWRYTFQQMSRCVDDDRESPWETSSTASAVRPIGAPARPAVAANTSGNTTTFTRSTVSCPAGTDAQYRLLSQSDAGYSSGWSGVISANSDTWNTSSQGYKYKKSYQARCHTAHTDSNWSTSGVGSYVRPVTRPTNIDWVLTEERFYPAIIKLQSYGICGPGARLFGDVTPWSGDYHWVNGPRAGKKGWYQLTGHQSVNLYEPTLTIAYTGTIENGSRFRGKGTFRCKNSDTGRQSATVENEGDTLELFTW